MSIKQVTLISTFALAAALAPSNPAAAPGAGSDPSESRRTGIVVATEKAAPAVVSITVRRSTVVAYGNSFFQDPFFDFFGPQYRRKETGSLGSGVIVSKEGYVLTNSHVVGASEGGELEGITVTLADGRQFPAKLIGADDANDLAVVRIKAPDLPVARIQEKADNMVGEWVVAIGNPYGYLIGDTKPTVTVGVISAVNRSFSSTSDVHYHNMIQTDASINPGNSGGALVNVDGKLIGINTFIFTGGGQSQGSIGLGFAIPIQKAKLVMDELIQYGRIREFTTGIYADPNMDQNRPGATVAGIDKGSPGDKAGLKAGDVLYEVAGKRINTLQDIQDVFKLFQVGESVEILYLRGQEKRKTSILLEEKPKRRKLY
ncbi:MAG TPA: trypsin-like peptidase domain-containing protein [Fibrobacteria bacterium]|nr:trypsin-like peptidase domain-containing protein [Fibrobacteria bacterium]